MLQREGPQLARSSMKILHTYICKISSLGWTARRIYALPHHLLGGISNIEKRCEIGVLVSITENIDDALSIIYKYPSKMFTITSHKYVMAVLPLLHR